MILNARTKYLKLTCTLTISILPSVICIPHILRTICPTYLKKTEFLPKEEKHPKQTRLDNEARRTAELNHRYSIKDTSQFDSNRSDAPVTYPSCVSLPSGPLSRCACSSTLYLGLRSSRGQNTRLFFRVRRARTIIFAVPTRLEQRRSGVARHVTQRDVT